LRGATRAHRDALGERMGRQDLAPIALDLVLVTAARRRDRRRRPLAEQVVGRQLDQRAGRTRRHARLIAVGHAVIALVGDAAGLGDASGARTEAERLLLVEALLEQ